MATVNPTPAPAPAPVAQLPGWFLGLFAAMCLAVVALFAVVLYDRKQPVPTPVVSPIPADTMAYIQSWIDGLNSVANGLDANPPTVKSDPASISAAIGAARKSANDKLAADVQAGGKVSANIREVAATVKGLVKGAK